MFERFLHAKGIKQKFYACSACRDRRECPFFQLVDEKVSSEKKESREELLASNQPRHSHHALYQRYKIFKELPPNQRKLCQKCHQVLLKEDWEEHKTHTVMTHISDKQLCHPTVLLQPLENNKKNAQYLFSRKACNFTTKTLKELGFTRIVCIGAPRIHEAIHAEKELGMQSLLLDIDHRYQQFYGPSRFCRYNMFNNYFFEGRKSEKVFEEFIAFQKEKVAIVMDPPFGGLVAVLAHTLNLIMEKWKQAPYSADCENKLDILPVLWYFPYFMENRITEGLPSFSMLDYKIDYENHSVFKNGPGGAKKGSPVRIFTNLPPSKFVFPSEEGYRYCSICDRYVANENRHCKSCNACTSKDGSTYKHCEECERCVKPSRTHCDTCKQCMLQSHTCGENKSSGCHICGDLSHKRRDCPVQKDGLQPKKRKHPGKAKGRSKRKK